MPMSDATVKDGTMCPNKTVGNPGIIMSQTCVDLTFFPSGKVMISGLVAMRLLTTSTPSMIKMDVAPVSAIARFRPIVMALITVVNGDNVATHIESHAGGVTMETLDAATVSLSAISKSCWVGSEVF